MALQQIFSLTEKYTNSFLFQDKSLYEKRVEVLNLLDLNDDEKKLTESKEFSLALNSNPKNYEDLLNLIQKYNNMKIFQISNIFNIQNKLPPSIINNIFNYMVSWKNPTTRTLDLKNLNNEKSFIDNCLINDFYIFFSLNNEIHIYDIKTFEFITILKGHYGYITHLKVNKKFLYSLCDIRIKIWDLDTFKCLYTINASHCIYDSNKDDNFINEGNENDFGNNRRKFNERLNDQNILNLIDYNTLYDSVGDLKNSNKPNITSMKINDNYIFLLINFKYIQIFDIQKLKFNSLIESIETINQIDLNDKYLFILGNDNVLVFFNLENYSYEKKIKFENRINNIKFNNSYICLRGFNLNFDHYVIIYDMNGKKVLNFNSENMVYFEFINEEVLGIMFFDVHNTLKIYDMKNFNIISEITNSHFNDYKFSINKSYICCGLLTEGKIEIMNKS
jgi:hypothetical protein